MKYSFGCIVLLGLVAAITADCGCPSCSKGNLQIVPSNSNVEIIYKGQPCSCQRALPYQVEVPLSGLPESRRSYEYQVVAPPRPSPPPQRYVYNYQLQVPVPQAPQQRLNGLLARLDRVVLPAPDCRSVNPALATDANSELYSDGNELTPIAGGYASQTIYSNGGLSSSGSYLSGSNYDNYNNNFGLSGSNNLGIYASTNALQQFENGGQISLRPCDRVRGPIVEQLRYFNDNEDTTNDYYSRYARNSINYSDESDAEQEQIDEERYIEANVPYIPDSDNLENYSLKNSEYSILEETPVRTNDYETDYYDDEDRRKYNYNYNREQSNESTDSDERPYLTNVLTPNDDANYYNEAIAVDNTFNTNDNNIDTDQLYKLYLEYVQNTNVGRHKRDLNQPPLTDHTTETVLTELLTYLNDNQRTDCSVPTENRSDKTNEYTTEQSLTTTIDNDAMTTTEMSLIPKATTSDSGAVLHSTQKHDQLKDIVRLFEKYNKIKEVNRNKSPVSLHKFLTNYPQAVKLMNNIGNKNTDFNDNHIDVTSQYFQPPMCPTIQNLLKHPKYNARQMTDTGILQYLPELKQTDERYVTPKELYQQRIFDINGLNVGPTVRKARSYATNPKPMFGTRFLPKGERLPLVPSGKYGKAGDLNLQRRVDNEEIMENNVYMPTNDRNTNQMFGATATKENTNYMLSAMSDEDHKEDTTTLYKAIDLKQKLREKQKQNHDEDSELYKKYLEIPALKKQENKYNKYFRIPEFARLNVDKSPIAHMDIIQLQQPEIIVPSSHVENDEERDLYDIERELQTTSRSGRVPAGAVMLPPGQKCKRHNTPYCACHSKQYSPKVQFFNAVANKPIGKINHMYDQGFGENFHNFASLKLKREEGDNLFPVPDLQTLDQFEQTAENLDVNASGEESANDSERFERTISFILSKLRNSRLLNYIRRRYNDRLARKLNGVVRNMDAINTLNAISSTNNVETNFNTDLNIDAHFSSQNANALARDSNIGYANRYDISTNVNRFNNDYQTVIKSKPSIVYDHLGHKYVEINGFRRLIRPNIQKQVEIQTNVVNPCVETVDIRSNNVQTSCNQNNYQNNLESELIVETNDILQREPVYKTETIEIIKPEKHIYYPQEKYIIQQTKVDQRPIITEEIKVTENSDRTCGQHHVVVEQGREIISRPSACQHGETVTEEKIITEERQNGDKVIVDEKIIQNASGDREIIKSIEYDESRKIIPERKIEIIEEQTIHQRPAQPNEVVITQTIEQQPLENAANIEIKETIKKYQIPVVSIPGGCTHNNCEGIDSTNQQTIITENHNEYQKLQQLQQFLNYLHLLQNQEQVSGAVDVSNQQLLSNLIANQQHQPSPQLLNNLLLNRLRLNNGQQNVQTTGNIKSFVKNSHASEQLTDINLNKPSSSSIVASDSLPLTYLGNNNLNNYVRTNNNVGLHSNQRIRSGEDHTDFDIHKNSIHNLNLDLLRHQAALNNVKHVDLNLHHSNNALNLLPNLGNHHLPLLNNNFHYFNNIDLQKHLNSYLNKRNSEDNCELNPDHSIANVKS